MSWSRVRAVLDKEWREARRNRGVAWTFLALAVVFIALPLGITLFMPDEDLDELAADRRSRVLLELMAERVAGFADLTPRGRLQAFLLRQLLQLFVILPVVGTMSIATFSIVGEKRSRSLEPLLATPVTTGELLLGKSLAAVLPSVVATWAAFGLFALAMRRFIGADVAGVVLDPAAWLTVALVVPLIAILAVAAGILISSRSRDPRSAQQVGSLILLPILAILAAQLTGVFLLGPVFVLTGAAVLLLADAALLRWGRKLFRRERILVRWR